MSDVPVPLIDADTALERLHLPGAHIGIKNDKEYAVLVVDGLPGGAQVSLVHRADALRMKLVGKLVRREGFIYELAREEGKT